MFAYMKGVFFEILSNASVCFLQCHYAIAIALLGHGCQTVKCVTAGYAFNSLAADVENVHAINIIWKPSEI